MVHSFDVDQKMDRSQYRASHLPSHLAFVLRSVRPSCFISRNGSRTQPCPLKLWNPWHIYGFPLVKSFRFLILVDEFVKNSPTLIKVRTADSLKPWPFVQTEMRMVMVVVAADFSVDLCSVMALGKFHNRITVNQCFKINLILHEIIFFDYVLLSW